MSYIIITTIMCYLMWYNIWSRIFNIRVKNIIHEHHCVHVSPNTYHNYILKHCHFLFANSNFRTTTCWITSLQITLFYHPCIYIQIYMLICCSFDRHLNLRIPKFQAPENSNLKFELYKNGLEVLLIYDGCVMWSKSYNINFRNYDYQKSEN